MTRDAIIGLVCLIGSVVLYATLGHIEEARGQVFPRTIIIIMGVLSALLLLQGLFLKKKEDKKGPKYPLVRVLTLFVIIVIYFYVLEPVGFYLSSFLFFIAVTFILGWQQLTPKKGAKWGLGALIFTGVLYVLFKVILEVQTPTGILI